jgi:hypothetical protein
MGGVLFGTIREPMTMTLRASLLVELHGRALGLGRWRPAEEGAIGALDKAHA